MKVNKKFVGAIFVLITLIGLLIYIKGTGTKQDDGKKFNKYIVIDGNGYKTKMDVEQFIPCVLFAQMSLENNIETIKAQAVVDRTYIAYMMKNKKEIEADELGLPYMSYEKMIKVCKDEKKLKGKKSALDVVKNIVGSSNNEQFKSKMQIIDKVMNETALMVMKNKGEIILPLYHEISGGMTRNGLEVLGEKYGYLLAGVCQDDYNNSDYKMERYFTMAELADKMEKAKIIIYDNEKNEIDLKNITVNEMIENTNIAKDSSEYAVSVKIFETGISGEDFANALNVDSSNITLEYIDDKIKITTKGKGNGFKASTEKVNTNYGVQYKVTYFEEIEPDNKDSIIAYIIASKLKGIGPKKAEAIYNQFGDDTLKVLDSNFSEIKKVKGLSSANCSACEKKWKESRSLRNIMKTIGSDTGLSQNKLLTLHEKFGNKLEETIKYRTYDITKINGITFAVADKIAKKQLNYDPSSDERIKSCIRQCLLDAMQDGHLFLTPNQLIYGYKTGISKREGAYRILNNGMGEVVVCR